MGIRCFSVTVGNVSSRSFHLLVLVQRGFLSLFKGGSEMYSAVLMLALTAGADSVDFGHHRRGGGCCGSYGGCSGCYGGYGGYGGYGCCGGYGGCYSSGYGGYGCSGSYGGCSG